MKKTTKIVILIPVIILFVSVTSILLLKQGILHKFLNHPVVQYEGKDPTCLEEGYLPYEKCTKCDYTTLSILPATGHDIVNYEKKESTCAEEGHYPYEACTKCDYTTYLEIPKIKHKLVSFRKKDPTCTEDGYEAYVECSECDYTTFSKIPAIGHDLIHHERKSPTCERGGYKEYDECNRCYYTTYKELPPRGHDLVHHERKEPTCTENGYEYYDTCNRCNYCKVIIIPKLSHDFINCICSYCDINAAEYLQIGKTAKEMVTNDNVGYDFYMTQSTSGKYSKSNCLPACVYMVSKWSNENFSKTVEDIRNMHIKPSAYDDGWYLSTAKSALDKCGVKNSWYAVDSVSNTYDDEQLEEVKELIRNGNILITGIITKDISPGSQNTLIGQAYEGADVGHGIVIKGFIEVDGKLYFEIYDPAVAHFYNNPILGSNNTRYYDAIELINSAHKHSGWILASTRG